MKWYFKVLAHYFDFKGRARRREYWMSRFVFLMIILIFSLLILILSLTYDDVEDSDIIFTLFGLFIFLHIIPFYAVTVRRLHDIGKSGWFIFINLVPIFGNLIFLVNMLSDSEKGENKYGPNPKEENK